MSASGMSTTDIDKMMIGYPQFAGTIASDEIPLLKTTGRKRIAWIMNTESSKKAGEHWVAFILNPGKSLEYYNSLSDPLTDLPKRTLKDLQHFILSHGGDANLLFHEKSTPDQNNVSNNCGEFSVRFIQERLRERNNGESYAKASGLDANGEHTIELWKKEWDWID